MTVDKEQELSVEPHAQHQGHGLHLLLLGTALAAGAVILAPYVLPSFGIGTATFNSQLMTGAMGAAIEGHGLAGLINNNIIAAIPFVGSTLAQGGLWTAAAAGVTGVGGLILSHYIGKKEDGSTQIHWSRIIRTAALVTSTLIALPAVLTSLTIGIACLSAAISGSNAMGTAVLGAYAKFGTGVGGMSAAAMGGGAGIAALLPHLFTCGAAIIPAAITWFAGGKKHDTHTPHHATHTDAAMPGMTMGGYTHLSSFDMQKNTPDIVAKITVAQPTAAHVPCEATLTLSHADGAPLTAEELAVTHTQKIHLFVVDQALKDYRHIHPVPTQTPGVWQFSFTPATSNHYSAWVDCATLADGKEHIAKADIASATRRNMTPSISVNSRAEQDGLQLEWKTGEPLRQGEPRIVEVFIRDSQGNPVTDLEPVMGAYAHLVGFSADGNSFAHTHPLGSQPSGAQDRGGPLLRFQIEPDKAGKVQYHLHIQRGGQTIYVPFGQQVKQALAEEVLTPRYASMAMAR